MMSRARRGQGDVKGSTLRQMRGTLREEEAVPAHLADGLLLSHYEERRSKICEVSWLSGASQSNPHLFAKLAKHGYPMALTHVGARFSGASQPIF